MRPRVARATLAPAAVLEQKAEKPRCGSCGVRIPPLVSRPYRCSYCVREPYWGNDRYFLDIINEELASLPKMCARRLILESILTETSRAKRRVIARVAYP